MADAPAPAASFTGYASLFNVPDLGRDIIAPGAFAACLRRASPQRVAMLYQHDATRPVGIWRRLRETERGLWVEGRLALASDGGRNAWALLQAGALDGLSIGFRTVRAQPLPQGRRRLLEVELVEISLVTFPMQPQARVRQLGAAAQPAGAPPAFAPPSDAPHAFFSSRVSHPPHVQPKRRLSSWI